MENSSQYPKSEPRPVWISNSDETKNSKEIEDTCRDSIFYEKLLADTYKKDELLIFFDEDSDGGMTLEERIKETKESFESKGFKGIKVVKCDDCDIPVVLFKATHIHSVVNIEGGTDPGLRKHGEEYSLNFYNKLPYEKNDKLVRYPKDHCCAKAPKTTPEGKKTIVVAVLDTGLDTELVDPGYLWEATSYTTSNCYKDAVSGWNFVEDDSQMNSPSFYDDDPQKHGSLVSQYIINEFSKSTNNKVQIMPLKTHNKEGVGDLFHAICAIHFAIAKGANIINASWGFYYYSKTPIPYLDKVISTTLQEKNILFITAAGNQDKKEEESARLIYFNKYGLEITDQELRDIAIHNFYPAHLSSATNNVITVTTTDIDTSTNEEVVSETQNFSHVYADIGVMADQHMKFRVPFPNVYELISGSSFATAVATGVIGATIYSPGMNKEEFLTINNSRPAFPPFSIIKNLKEKIKEGVVIDRKNIITS